LDSHKDAIKRINQTVIDKDNKIHQLENELDLLNSQSKD